MGGQGGLKLVGKNDHILLERAELLKSDKDKLSEKLRQLLGQNRTLEKELEQIKGKLASSQGNDLAQQAIELGGVKVLAVKLDGADPKSLRSTLDQLKQKMGSSAIVLAAVDGSKVSLVAGVSKDRTDVLKAGELINVVAQKIGGKGVSRGDMAKGGCQQPGSMDALLAGG